MIPLTTFLGGSVVSDRDILKNAQKHLDEAERCIKMLQDRGWCVKLKRDMSFYPFVVVRPLEISATRTEVLE
jgi:hypothetical protein